MTPQEITDALRDPSPELIDVFHDAVGPMPIHGLEAKSAIVKTGVAAMVRFLETGERPVVDGFMGVGRNPSLVVQSMGLY